MQTSPTPFVDLWFQKHFSSEQLQLAKNELLKCVHCGMCNATCPTYQITGNELDGPRGRLYQIKLLLEGNSVEESHRFHLDRCLQCRACETTCPSGVGYHHVLEVGKQWVNAHLPQKPLSVFIRRALTLLAFRSINAFLWPIARTMRPFLPHSIQQKVPSLPTKSALPIVVAKMNTESSSATPPTSYLLMQGCVQPAMLPNIHHATQQVFASLNIHLQRLDGEQCCGALPHHIGHELQALSMIENNLRRWTSYWENHPECLGMIVNASGCGLMVREYPQVIQSHRNKNLMALAQQVSSRVFEPMEVLMTHTSKLQSLMRDRPPPAKRLVFQAPCTLQHGLKLQNQVEAWLAKLFMDSGVTLMPVDEPHLCCGSAGTYSIQQPKLAQQLRLRKWENLMRHRPDRVLTANVGCHSHLQGAGSTPVQHYLEFLAEWLAIPHKNHH